MVDQFEGGSGADQADDIAKGDKASIEALGDYATVVLVEEVLGGGHAEEEPCIGRRLPVMLPSWTEGGFLIFYRTERDMTEEEG